MYFINLGTFAVKIFLRSMRLLCSVSIAILVQQKQAKIVKR